MSVLFNEKQIKGLTTELICMQKFIEYGFIVSVPYGNNSRYDLLVDIGNQKFLRIQCKSAALQENDSYVVKTCNAVATTTKRTEKYYTKDQIDFIATIIQDQLVIIPVDLIEHCQSKVFRTVLPKYGTKSTCNLIENYTVEKYILPLIS